MCGWGDGQIKFYLLGTPIIWWSTTISLFLGLFTAGWYVVRKQRQYKDWAPGEWDQFLHVGKVAFGGWALHYMPFLIMDRVTYLHHYVSHPLSKQTGAKTCSCRHFGSRF